MCNQDKCFLVPPTSETFTHWNFQTRLLDSKSFLRGHGESSISGVRGIATGYDAVGESMREKLMVNAFIRLLSPVVQNETGVSELKECLRAKQGF